MDLKTFTARNNDQGRALLEVDFQNWATGVGIRRMPGRPPKIRSMVQSHPTPEEIVLTVAYD